MRYFKSHCDFFNNSIKYAYMIAEVESVNLHMDCTVLNCECVGPSHLCVYKELKKTTRSRNLRNHVSKFMCKPVDTGGDAAAEPRHCSRSFCISVFISQRQRGTHTSSYTSVLT